MERDKEGGIIITPTVGVLFEVDFGSGIEVHLSLFVYFAKHHALPLLKVYARDRLKADPELIQIVPDST